MKLKPNIFLVFILVLILSFRLYLAFSTPYFDSDQAYFNVRVIEEVISTKTPFSFDPLSYGGREIISPQLFHYIIALFHFIPNFMKIIPEIFITSLAVIAYLIAKKITKDPLASMITAVLVSFSPALLSNTVNQVSVYALAIPIIYLMLYLLMELKNNYTIHIIVVLSFLLPMLHPISFFFAFSLLFFMILLISESVKIEKLAQEFLHYEPFDLTEALARKDIAQALKIFHFFYEMSEDITMIVGLLHWQLKRLWQAKKILAHGGGPNDVARTLRIPPSARPIRTLRQPTRSQGSLASRRCSSPPGPTSRATSTRPGG